MYLGHQKSRHWFKSYDGEKWIISSNGATPSSYLVLLDMRLTCAGKSLSDLSQHPGALTSPNFLFLVPLITLVTQVTSKTAIAKTCCRVDRDIMAKVVQITYTRLDSLSSGDF